MAIPLLGHINPLLAQAGELRRRGWRVHLASTDEVRQDRRCTGWNRKSSSCRWATIPTVLTHVVGIDWAMTRDFTAMSVLDVTDFEQRRIERFNMIDYHVQTDRLLTLVEMYKPVAIIAELNVMGVPLVQDLQRRGLPAYGFQTTSLSKKVAIEGLALAMERGQVKLLADQVQKGELLAFESQGARTRPHAAMVKTLQMYS